MLALPPCFNCQTCQLRLACQRLEVGIQLGDALVQRRRLLVA